ncbi:MAG: hypothetical protein D6788_00160 [Planctomycetota bacterium]|nr:MAG: hypothetical protein D6788_00160 [Planctomycetota bacterium]
MTIRRRRENAKRLRSRRLVTGLRAGATLEYAVLLALIAGVAGAAVLALAPDLRRAGNVFTRQMRNTMPARSSQRTCASLSIRPHAGRDTCPLPGADPRALRTESNP